MILYVYKEHNPTGFDQVFQVPFPLSESAQQFTGNNFKVFKLLGGLRIIDYYNSPFEFIRLSFWNSADAYANWESHPLVKDYIEARKKYHSNNNIKTHLSGPLQASVYE